MDLVATAAGARDAFAKAGHANQLVWIDFLPRRPIQVTGPYFAPILAANRALVCFYAPNPRRAERRGGHPASMDPVTPAMRHGRYPDIPRAGKASRKADRWGDAEPHLSPPRRDFPDGCAFKNAP